MAKPDKKQVGMMAAYLTPAFMGFAPIFGKLALNSGLDAYTLAAIRTVAAAAFLWLAYLIFWRKYIFIFPAGILFTFVVGAVNGFGSLLYYNGLFLLDNASLVQLLQMLYVIFVLFLTRLYGGSITKLSIIRSLMALAAVYLLTIGNGPPTEIQWIGVGLMIGSAALYGLHVVLSQRVMYEMPAPTMALYALTSMAVVVLAARLFYGTTLTLPWAPLNPVGWWWIGGLAVVTALSRVTLFAGVRNIGALQAILLNMAEIGVTLIAGFALLGERMTPIQWIGVIVMLGSVLLSRWDGGQGHGAKSDDKTYRKQPSSASMAQDRLTQTLTFERTLPLPEEGFSPHPAGDR